jgi:hypothetical protein
MITIIATPTRSGKFLLETSKPIDGKVISEIVNSEAEATRKANHFTRLYITEKMMGWLHQRIIAARVTNKKDIEVEGLALLASVEHFNNMPVRNICKIILDEQNVINKLAPGLKSPSYAYYKGVILKIIYFCKKEVQTI